MDKNPLFSVIIPTYNNALRLKDALNSVNKQTFRDFEVIICDDGSIDNTKEIVSSFSDKLETRYLWDKNWGGPARPRNNGLKVARGEFVAFLDSDDQWYPNKLSVTYKSLSTRADVIFHDLDIYTDKGKKFLKKVKGRNLKPPVFIDLMKNENSLITSGVIVRKDTVVRVGGFTEQIASLPMVCVEDFDLWLKIARMTDKFVYIPKSLGFYRIRKNNVSQASSRVIERIELVYNKYQPLLNNRDRTQSDSIKSYLLGRIKQKLGLYKDAYRLFKIATKSKNLKFKIRSLIWLILLKLKYRA